MKMKELKDLGPVELTSKEQDLRRELFNLRFQASTGDIQNPSRMRLVKRDIARVQTALSQKNAQAKGGN